MLMVIVGKFCEGEPLLPIGLLVVDVEMEEDFNFLVYSFCLAISLGMVSCGSVTGRASS
jgi:hypothetical protein